MGEYHDLYLKTDILLLHDVSEKFSNVCLSDYGLDTSHYFSSPGLAWDSMLEITGVKLEKSNNIDAHLFLEKGMRGGITNISKRYAKSDENTKIMYWDMNNLYGTIMSFDYLPYGGFKFLSEEEIKVFDLSSIAENSLIGYISEVDLEYPKELHDSHNDYLLCPENIEVKYGMLFNYCKETVDWYSIKIGGAKKLIPNLCDKFKHIDHYKNLQYYLSLGMKLVKIHRILKFKQNNWLKSYVDFNTEKRKESPDEFSKNLCKLLNNCIYGKSIENIRQRINVKLINDKKKSKNY